MSRKTIELRIIALERMKGILEKRKKNFKEKYDASRKKEVYPGKLEYECGILERMDRVTDRIFNTMGVIISLKNKLLPIGEKAKNFIDFIIGGKQSEETVQ